MAHIYPFFSLAGTKQKDKDERTEFWKMLECFWPAPTIAAWKANLFKDGLGEPGMDRCTNLLSLTHSFHHYWNFGAFALKPLDDPASDPETELKLLFVWQAKHSAIQSPVAKLNLCAEAPSTANLDHSSTFNFWMVFGESEPRRLIRSGDIITMKTSDPFSKPLPNRQLLEMQWFLQRVAGMSGAGEVFALHENSDDGSDYGSGVAYTLEDEDVDELALDTVKGKGKEVIVHEVEILPITEVA